MIIEFVEGMHKVGEAQCTVISAQVTREAQERLKAEQAAAK